MVAEELFINDFFDKLKSGNTILLDARSPSEFFQAHIPGAINLPLLNDEHRKEVGITYKQKGREAAVIKGFDLVGNKFSTIITEAIKLSPSKNVMLYCWRGGMRSGILSWLLGLAGFKVTLLKGGYKSYRRKIFQILDEPKKIIVLGGKTGSGKTEVLEHLRQMGEQVICLETIAHHRGSAFGAMGMKPQPRQEMFENILAEEWAKMDSDKNLWLENESRNVGSMLIPEKIFSQMRNAPVVELVVPLDFRLNRILNEYATFPAEELIANTKKIEKRLGGMRLQEAIAFLKVGKIKEWALMMLEYYDRQYNYGMEIRPQSNIHKVESSELSSVSEVAKMVRANSEKVNFNAHQSV